MWVALACVHATDMIDVERMRCVHPTTHETYKIYIAKSVLHSFSSI